MEISYPFFNRSINSQYQKLGITVNHESTSVGKVELLGSLTTLQKEHLLKGDGQKDGQYKQINSSTGLVINYLKLLEETKKISDLDFELKLGRPLRWGRDVNLDAYFKHNGTIVYIESKFLEPYCNGNDSNVHSYFESDKYASNCSRTVNDWIELFLEAEKFNNYNVAQLCRHLLAIYRYSKKEHISTPIELCSFVWLPNKNFLNLIHDEVAKENLKNTKENVIKESGKCQELLNNFIHKINWNNMTFKAKAYNSQEMLDAISSAKEYQKFKVRYFLD